MRKTQSDRRMALPTKRKICETVARAAILYGETSYPNSTSREAPESVNTKIAENCDIFHEEGRGERSGDSVRYRVTREKHDKEMEDKMEGYLCRSDTKIVDSYAGGAWERHSNSQTDNIKW